MHQEHKGDSMTPLTFVAYASLLGIWVAANFVIIPVPVNLIASSTLIIYIGCHRSLKLRDKAHPDNAEVRVFW